MCTTGYDCKPRLSMNKLFLKFNAFDYEVKVDAEEAFIIITDDLINGLLSQNTINQLSVPTKNSENYVYTISQYPEVLLLHIKDDKFALIDNNTDVYKLLSNHSYTSLRSLRSFAKHLKTPGQSNSVHHKMETFDNRDAALELAPKPHNNHGSHQVKISFSNGTAAFDTFIDYIRYTGNLCHNCHLTIANSKVKYIKEL